MLLRAEVNHLWDVDLFIVCFDAWETALGWSGERLEDLEGVKGKRKARR
jgi:hypothetical protein